MEKAGAPEISFLRKILLLLLLFKHNCVIQNGIIDIFDLELCKSDIVEEKEKGKHILKVRI